MRLLESAEMGDNGDVTEVTMELHREMEWGIYFPEPVIQPAKMKSSSGKEFKYNGTQPQSKEKGKDCVVFLEQCLMLSEKMETHFWREIRCSDFIFTGIG